LFFPVPVLLVGDQLLVNSDYDLPHGTEILSVNNIPASIILDSVMMYNTVEGYRRKTQKYLASTDLGLQLFMKYGGTNKFTVTVKDTSGITKTMILEGINLDELYTRQRNLYYYDRMDVDYSLVIDDSLKRATLRLITFEFNGDNKQNSFESFLKNSFELLKRRNDIKSLIIDLRENTGGSLYNCFLLNSYLARKPFAEYKDVFSRIKSVPYEEYLSSSFTGNDVNGINTRLKNDFAGTETKVYHLKDSLLESWLPQKSYFSGNVYIITNWAVNSSASYFSLLAKTTAGAKIVGFETAGGSHSGNGFVTIKYCLSNTGIEFYFPYVRLLYTNGEPFPGKGVIPDYIVPDTYDSFKKNEDKQIVYIIDSLIGKH
jgi:C-terminal processing protease CtpA/Prc